MVQTSKYYMRDVTAVESSWLVELAPHFYKQAKVSPRKESHTSAVNDVSALKRSGAPVKLLC